MRHDASAGGDDSPESNEFEMREHRRLARLYEGLTEEERRFVVVQWEEKHCFEKNENRLRGQRRQTLAALFAAILLLGLAVHFLPKYAAGQDAVSKLEYIYARAEEHSGLAQG